MSPLQPRLYIHAPPIVFAAQVNQVEPATYPAEFIPYDNVTVGDYAEDVEPGMTVSLGTTPGGDDLGRHRVVSGSTDIVIRTGYASRGVHDGELYIVDNTYITVRDDRRIWAKIPFIDSAGVYFKDRNVEVADHNEFPYPVANCGPDMGGTADEDTEELIVTLNGSHSVPIATGAILVSFLWDIKDGDLISGSLTDAVITASFPIGSRHPSLTVTDSNGKSHKAWNWVVVDSPVEEDRITTTLFSKTSHTITEEGQAITVSILKDLPRSIYPDGMECMIWDSEPGGSANRDHMVFSGWHQSDTNGNQRKETGSIPNLNFQLVDVGGRMGKLPGFAQTLTDEILRDEELEPETTWQYMPYPNIDKFHHSLIYWQSDVLERADFFPSGTGVDYPFVQLQVGGESLLAQARRLPAMLVPDYKLVINKLGQLIVIPEQNLLDVEDRTDNIVVEIAEDEWSQVSWPYERGPGTHALWGEATLTATNYVVVDDDEVISQVKSIAPGAIYGQGLGESSNKAQLARSQAALNRVTGHRYAMINAPYGLLTIRVPGDLIRREFDYSVVGWLVIHIPSDKAGRRGLPSTTLRGIVKSISIRDGYDETGYTLDSTLTVRLETSGPPAFSWSPGIGILPDEPPEITLLGDDPMTLPFGMEFGDPGATASDPEDGDITDEIVVDEGALDVMEPGSYGVTYNVTDSSGNPATEQTRTVTVGPFPDTGLREGIEVLAGIGLDGYVYQTTDFQTPNGSGGPTYNRQSMGISEEIYSWVVDPFSPGYVNGTGTGLVNSFLASETNIYRITDLHGTVTVDEIFTFPVVADASAFHWRTISASFGAYFPAGANPWIVCVSYYGDTPGHTGTWVTYSTDGGVTWSAEVQISAYYDIGIPTRFNPIGVFTSPRTPGKAYTAAHVAVDDDPLHPLPRWGLFDTENAVFIGSSLGASTSHTVSVDIGPSDTAQDGGWALLLAPPDDAKRVVVQGVYSAERYSGSTGIGSFSTVLSLANINGTLHSRVGDHGFTLPTYNAGVAGGSFEIQWTRVGAGDWVADRDDIVATPPTGGTGDDPYARFFMEAEATTTANKSTGGFLTLSLYISEIELNDGTIYVPSTGVGGGFVSTNSGEGWTTTAVIDPGDALAGSIHVPWPDNADEQLAYFGHFENGLVREFRLMQSVGGVITDISPTDSGIAFGANRCGFTIRAYDSDRTYMLLAGIGNDTSADPADDLHAIFLSVDEGGSWTPVVAPMADTEAPPGRPALEAAFAGDDPDVHFYWGAENYIAYTDDGGSSVDSRAGNLSSFGNVYLIGIAGGPT